jgi:hypothetical protein
VCAVLYTSRVPIIFGCWVVGVLCNEQLNFTIKTFQHQRPSNCENVFARRFPFAWRAGSLPPIMCRQWLLATRYTYARILHSASSAKSKTCRSRIKSDEPQWQKTKNNRHHLSSFFFYFFMSNYAKAYVFCSMVVYIIAGSYNQQVAHDLTTRLNAPRNEARDFDEIIGVIHLCSFECDMHPNRVRLASITI